MFNSVKQTKNDWSIKLSSGSSFKNSVERSHRILFSNSFSWFYNARTNLQSSFVLRSRGAFPPSAQSMRKEEYRYCFSARWINRDASSSLPLLETTIPFHWGRWCIGSTLAKVSVVETRWKTSETIFFSGLVQQGNPSSHKVVCCLITCEEGPDDVRVFISILRAVSAPNMKCTSHFANGGIALLRTSCAAFTCHRICHHVPTVDWTTLRSCNYKSIVSILLRTPLSILAIRITRAPIADGNHFFIGPKNPL